MDVHGDLEALLTEVHRRAEQRALERESEAAARSREIIAQARTQAEAEAGTRLDAAREDARELRRRSQAKHELERQRADLVTREHSIEAVWTAAEARLRELVERPEAYRPVLERLTAMAAATLIPPSTDVTAPSQEPTVTAATTLTLAADEKGAALLDGSTHEHLVERLGTGLAMAEEPLESWGGVEARLGRLRADLSFPTRLAQARSTLRELVWQTYQDGQPT